MAEKTEKNCIVKDLKPKNIRTLRDYELKRFEEYMKNDSWYSWNIIKQLYPQDM